MLATSEPLMKSALPGLALVPAALLVACTTSVPADRTTDAGSDAGMPNGDAGLIVIPVADGGSLHITESGVPNQNVTIPAGSYFNIRVAMHVTTSCDSNPPAGQNWPSPCDPYDRLAQISLDDDGGTPMFLLDAVTSFGGTTDWEQDVTDYASLITGTHSFKVDVGTYADPSGMATGTASSHDVSVQFELIPGTPPRDVVGVVPIFRQDITASTSSVMGTVVVPAGAAHGRLDFFTSGHGGNGNPPCDEFCQKYNDITVDTTSLFHMAPWVSCADNCMHESIRGSISCGGESFDYICQQNPTSCPPSATDSRANWCPSKIITPFQLDWPTADLTGRHMVGLSVENVNGDWSVGLAAVFYK
jgi:hypothetical protein